ncbi:MAG: ABC transporter ATP-binding protein/permease [Victivallales bacterium]|jgi:subfamily B ATP-binding cassette protein MsbA|nr:ABC transporter ATP-binding protein/permease [Victivallales bacterium]
MGRTSGNEKEFKAQSYFRLLSYARPYWFRLSVGIFAGILVGGSLLVSLLMIPRLIGAVEPESGVNATVFETEAQNVVKILEQPNLTTEERKKAVQELLHPVDSDPQLTKILNEARQAAKTYGLPFAVEGRQIIVYWPHKFQFEAVGENGRIAWQIFAVYVLVFVLAWTVKNLATFISHYYTRWVGAKVVSDLRDKVFDKLVNQSLQYYGKIDIGHLISRSTNDTSAIEKAVSNSVADLTSAPLQILACIIAIFIACREYDSYSLVVILLIGVPVIVLPINFLGRRIRKVYKKSFARIAEVFSRMHEVFTGIRVIKAYHTEDYECERFNKENHRYFVQVVKALRLQLLLSPAMEVVAMIASLAFFVYSYSKGVSLTEIAALLAPALMAYKPIKDMSKVVTSIQRSMAAADRYFELIDTYSALPEKPDAVKLDSFKAKIELVNAEFCYEQRKIIDGVSFEIPKGSMVAVVGETGSGKTTIANLIARFYDVTDGAVKIDGIDVRDYQIASLRKVIGVVNQDAILFNDTIANNIAYGCPDATREEIIEAAKLANAHNFIVDGRHAEGYDTEVGDKGFRLSGGEKQRVAIARAILRNPPILILDEATSALDTVTEKLVQEALTRVMAHRTVFAIAHRLSTIRNANQIIVLKDGKIAESGTHDELMAKKSGIYCKLYNTQFQLDE